MKVAPLIWELEKRRKRSPAFPVQHLLVHTGQHYGRDMMGVFFKDFCLPEPDVNLGVGSGSHALQTGRTMVRFEKICLKERPNLVVVVGDVNSTVACTLVAAKLGIMTAHVEAGLRSFDMTMPEEINRIATDLISDVLFTSCREANDNLERQGISKNRIYFVGNIMIDSLKHSAPAARRLRIYKELGLRKGRYAVLTLHRPSNVDSQESLTKILSALQVVSRHLPIVFPAHPRTRKLIKRFGLQRVFDDHPSFVLADPLGYLGFLSLMMDAKFVLTDSGGIQEETTALGIPCLTLRHNTERPITVRQGTNRVIGNDRERVIAECLKIMNGRANRRKRIPELWDGRTAPRIINVLLENLKPHLQR